MHDCPASIQWNGNVQFAMPFDIKLELGYLANKGLFLIDGDPGRPYDQLPLSTLAQYGCSPGAPTSQCTLLNQVPNPFNGVIGPGTTYSVASSSLTSSATIEQAALLKHWPQIPAFQASASRVRHRCTTPLPCVRTSN